MTGDLFTDAIRSPEALRSLYEAPSPLAARKQISEIDEMARRFIACSPLVFISSASAAGDCDVTPRGGPAGFVTVLDDKHLAIPDATGNKRLDTWHNVLETGRAGLLFVIPGRGQTLRINGAACLSARPELLDSLTAVGKPPVSALVLRAEEVYAHCPKAFVRSKAWQPEGWPDPSAQPTPAEVTHAHLRSPEITIAMVEQSQRESLLYRLE
ncbi:MSMEG_1061 family FMN-dependent PPOX-type flavoprotein [Crossiella sp. CA198]|uniref:MSMEG_1061 family FMN-dependent PPOX-type flavoprotein n=1 Tax=Crossiella sp. CA198 TaxID=3455607 RepID=UPI003F8D02F3